MDHAGEIWTVWTIGTIRTIIPGRSLGDIFFFAFKILDAYCTMLLFNCRPYTSKHTHPHTQPFPTLHTDTLHPHTQRALLNPPPPKPSAANGPNGRPPPRVRPFQSHGKGGSFPGDLGRHRLHDLHRRVCCARRPKPACGQCKGCCPAQCSPSRLYVQRNGVLAPSRYVFQRGRPPFTFLGIVGYM